jgi:hypothetical protein
MANAMRFYTSWAVLVAVHFWIFYSIPRSNFTCKLKTDTNSQTTGSTKDESLNIFSCSLKNSGYTVMFYILFCIYFALVAM